MTSPAHTPRLLSAMLRPSQRLLRHRKTTFLIAIIALMAYEKQDFYASFWPLNPLRLLAAHAGTPPSLPAKPALTVTIAKPQVATLGLQFSAHGNIAAWQEALIGSQSNGLPLKEVLANVGDSVRKGQVLARFADDTITADLQQARAALAEAQATAAEASANAERARSLQHTDALSAQQLAQYLTTEKTAAARAEAAHAALSTQQLRLAQTQVLAPDDGIVSARSATLGAVAGAGIELFRLLRQGRLEWRAEVTASELVRLKPGTPVTVTAASGAIVKGRVRMIAPTVDPQTRAALVYVDIPPMGTSAAVAAAPVRPKQGSAPSAGSDVREATSMGALILPGMFAKGSFELGSSSALTLPQQAVVIRDGFTSVFRLGADNRVAQVRVQTGRRSGTQVEVLEGLKPDDAVVVTGAGFLNDGDLVKVVK